MPNPAGRRKLVFIPLLLLAAFVAVPAPRAQKSPSPSLVQPKPESFWDKLLRYAGISHDPSNLKAPGDEVVTGQIWLVDLVSGTHRKLTAAGGFRSPVILPAGNAILALKGTDVVRVPTTGGDASKLYSLGQVTKLVGFSLDDPDQLLLLAGSSSENSVAEFLSLKSGKVTPLPFNPASRRDLAMLEHLRSWERVYGNKSLYTERRSKETLYGKAEWTDVYLKTGNNEPQDISQCDGANCGQPSLSADGRLVVFIKADHD